jgi:thioredoxin reductase (NADPH)
MQDQEDLEVLIVGAGASGISTALWLHDLEIPFRWICSDTAIGGTLQRVGNPVANFAGLDVSEGKELIPHFDEQLEAYELEPEFGTRLVSIDSNADRVTAILETAPARQVTSTFAAAVIATGTRPRMLGLEGEAELLGDGVEISVTRTRHRYKGVPVAVVGGGDAALEGALLLAENCPRVLLIHRRDSFRAQKRFVDEVESNEVIELLLNEEVEELHRHDTGAIAGITLTSGARREVHGLFERIGVEPAVPEHIPEKLLREDGYIDVEASGRTAVPGIYAVGDVAAPHHQSVAWAVGSGAHVATAIQRDLGRRSKNVSPEQ